MNSIKNDPIPRGVGGRGSGDRLGGYPPSQWKPGIPPNPGAEGRSLYTHTQKLKNLCFHTPPRKPESGTPPKPTPGTPPKVPPGIPTFFNNFIKK